MNPNAHRTAILILVLGVGIWITVEALRRGGEDDRLDVAGGTATTHEDDGEAVRRSRPRSEHATEPEAPAPARAEGDTTWRVVRSTGEPMAGGTVTVLRPDFWGTRELAVDEAGVVSCPAEVAAALAATDVVFATPGSETVFAPFGEAGAVGRTDVAARMRRVHVVVEGEDGEPWAAVQVILWPDFGGAERARPGALLRLPEAGGALAAAFVGITAADGRATFAHLPRAARDAGSPYRVFVGRQQMARGVSVPDREDAVVHLTLSRVAVRGRVVDRTGVPVRGATVSVHGGGVAPASIAVDGAGGFAMHTEMPGDRVLWVRASADGFARERRRVELPAGARSHDLTLEMDALRRIAGVVVSRAGAAVPRTRLTFLREDQDLLAARTDAAGEFTVEQAAEGTWRVSVSPPEPPGRWIVPNDVRVEGGDEACRIVLEEATARAIPLEVELVDFETGLRHGDGVRNVKLYPESGGRRVQNLEVVNGVATGVVSRGSWTILAEAFRTVFRDDFDVSGAEAQVRRTIRVGPPGNVRLRVTWDETIAPHDRPEKLFVISQPSSIGRWRRDGARLTPGIVVASPDVAEYLVEDVPPGRPVGFRVSHSVLAGECEPVSAPFGGVADTTLHVVRGGKLTFELSAAVAGVMHVEIRRGSGPWTGITSQTLRAGEPEQKSLCLRPGRVRWRARFAPQGGTRREIIADGVTLVTANTPVLIPIPPE